MASSGDAITVGAGTVRSGSFGFGLSTVRIGNSKGGCSLAGGKREESGYTVGRLAGLAFVKLRPPCRGSRGQL
jgi:hypothetical protein